MRTFDDFRVLARALVQDETPPHEVLWTDGTLGQGALFDEAPAPSPAAAEPDVIPRLHVPRAFVEIAFVACHHRELDRFALAYRVLWRLTHGEPRLLEIAADPDVVRLRALAQAVRRDEHKMHAFVRFRRLETETGERFVAWYAPDQLTLPLAAPFFARRFPAMAWSILTPDGSAHWPGDDGDAPAEIVFGPGVPQHEAPAHDELEDLFRTYYEAIFNPARVNKSAMRAELPQKRWSGLPETAGMVGLLMGAREKERVMRDEAGAAPFVPDSVSLAVLAKAARDCRGCPLHEPATQTVFGEGPRKSTLMIIGEQPGDHEDLEGHPFVGPAGKVLDEGLAKAGIDRASVYLTNAVKHFKFEPRGKRRIHKKPAHREVLACRPWLEAEIASVRPKIILCLGVVAAQSFFGSSFTLSSARGEVRETSWADAFVVTYHPSALLRIPDEEARNDARADFARDLGVVAKLLAEAASTRLPHGQFWPLPRQHSAPPPTEVLLTIVSASVVLPLGLPHDQGEPSALQPKFEKRLSGPQLVLFTDDPRVPQPKTSSVALLPHSTLPGPLWRVAKNESASKRFAFAQAVLLPALFATSAPLLQTCHPGAQRSATLQPLPLGLVPSSPAPYAQEGV